MLSFTLSFSPEIVYELSADKDIVLQSRDRKLTFKNPTDSLRKALTTLKTDKGATEQELSQIVQQSNDCELSTFNLYLTKLIGLGWISFGIDLATAIPLTEDFQFTVPTVDWQQSFTLSRFAYLHQVAGEMILESPLSQAKICLHDWRGAALIAKLAQPQTIEELAEIPALTKEEIELFLSLLLAAQMLDADILAANSNSLEQNTVLKQWDFHDLLFHTRSRQGRHNQPMGATYRFADKIAPLPTVKPQMSSKTVQLYKPNIKELKVKDISLTEAIEIRRSLRNYDTPITAQQLGEFLYRTARVKQLIKLEQGEYTSRPYPSGGGLYELELYPLINTCTGIDAGFYHYDPLTHQLCQLSEPTKNTERLLKDAWSASGQQDRPQILIAIAARFPRLAWKYESVAYSLILKHVGSLYQTMYLVATAMNLAPCALGSGNADLFTKVARTNYYKESSVGEFMLGSSPH